MRLLVTGSSGLVGTRLIPMLEADGHDCHRLTRSRSDAAKGFIFWNPDERQIDQSKLNGFDGVIHLAGASIATRWTAEKKRRIRVSRVDATRLLSEALANVDVPPRVLLSASAIGYYGNRADEEIDESSGPGKGYLPDICVDWEAAVQPMQKIGVRIVHLRIGLVLAREGGALARLWLPFRLGLGGRIGSGNQYMSWLTLDELVNLFRFALNRDDLSGAFNAVTPNPVTNAEFTRVLGRTLRRPTPFPLSATLVRLLFGEMGETLLLGGARVYPRRFMAAGYKFLSPGLEEAIQAILNK